MFNIRDNNLIYTDANKTTITQKHKSFNERKGLQMSTLNSQFYSMKNKYMVAALSRGIQDL
jgi:hypothetical protein